MKKKTEEKFDAKQFRKELTGVLPGYKWTVKRTYGGSHWLIAEGIQSSGFNRLSTVRVLRNELDDGVHYTCSSSGFGKKSPKLGEYTAPTLKQALRGLQDHYEYAASQYASHAGYIQGARKKRKV